MTLPSMGVSVAMISSLENRLLGDHRNMRMDHLPACIGKSNPGLGLPPGHVAPANLVDKTDSGDVSTESHDVQAQALLLGPRSGRARDTKGVDAVESVAVFGVGEPNGVRTLPEGGVEHLDILVDQRLLVALEQSPHLFDDIGNVRRQIRHALA